MMPASIMPGANGSLGVSIRSGSASPRAAAGRCTPTSRPSVVSCRSGLGRRVLGEGGVRDHAADLASRVHSGVRWKSPPTSLPSPTSTSPPSRSAETSSRRWAGLFSISRPQQPAQHERSLRVADEHDAAAAVSRRQVLAPRLEHVGVGELAVGAGAAGLAAVRAASVPCR